MIETFPKSFTKRVKWFDMKTEILSEKQNIFLRRKELQVAIEHENEPTPSKAALQELIVRQLNEVSEKIDVRSVYSDKGQARSLAKIFIWEEPPKKKEKKQEKKEETKTETKAEA